MTLNAELRGLGRTRRLEHALELHHQDVTAINTREEPDKVAPRTNGDVRVEGEQLTAVLKPLSWNVIVTRAAP